MGEEDLITAERVFELLAAGDVEGLVALHAVDAEIGTISGGTVDAEGLRSLLSDGRRREPTNLRFEAVAPGMVSVTGRLRVRDGGRLSDSPAAWILQLERGLVRRVRAFTNVQHAWAAVEALRPAAALDAA